MLKATREWREGGRRERERERARERYVIDPKERMNEWIPKSNVSIYKNSSLYKLCRAPMRVWGRSPLDKLLFLMSNNTN